MMFFIIYLFYIFLLHWMPDNEDGVKRTDIGRSAWENAWRVAVERFNNQKSPQNNLETPLHSYSGMCFESYRVRIEVNGCF